MTPLLTNPAVAPAFDNMFPALVGPMVIPVVLKNKEGRPESWMALSHGGRNLGIGKKYNARSTDLLLRYCVSVNKKRLILLHTGFSK